MPASAGRERAAPFLLLRGRDRTLPAVEQQVVVAQGYQWPCQGLVPPWEAQGPSCCLRSGLRELRSPGPGRLLTCAEGQAVTKQPQLTVAGLGLWLLTHWNEAVGVA